MTYDLVIVGGGPAGLTAGIYAARARVKALIIERALAGGKLTSVDLIENYPGFPEPISGAELSSRMEEQVRRLGVPIKNADVAEVKVSPDGFVLRTRDEEITARTVIWATGSGPSPLGVPGEDRLRGRGVSYCAICDGFFFRDQEVAVVGGGDSAVQEALYLTRFVKKVYLIHRRDTFRATPILLEQLEANSKIEKIVNTVVKEIKGEEGVTGLELEEVTTGKQSFLPVSGVFIYVGVKPASHLVQDLVDLDRHGYIITDEKMATRTPGLFAAGDVRQKPLRQIVTAVADGAVAAMSAERYLRERKS
ncbi:thioredoxin-disulfide reductase [Ammonifex thiophilus]|uniref:Thioredoxin reductase n=1 Tax=Ammonifex thiophilus TaxID=444093 RepID=A0A3D8P7D0_9THEO|nr:thioredoxin-disulfide reductase [Ammonifex thiophilus]RDV84772.1 thioredoxin-disulfide reductase [Ammonifex thiophilus]